ncbi:MAG TPA: hypothetical protein VFT28_02945 [Gemmatimonadales bacterium]|nr:hypothetical protein [Gemmatimonadales bacterium]
MPVSRGHALVLSAALHTLGVGAAGWTTYGPYHGPSARVELRTTRAYALTFVNLAPPVAAPAPRPPRAAEQPRPEARRREPPRPTQPAPTPVTGPAELDSPAAAPDRAAPVVEPEPMRLRVEELAPGTTAAVLPVATPTLEGPSEPEPPASSGVYRAAALVSPAGSACPALPVPREWGEREVSVAVAFVVDTSGKVDPTSLRVVQSPGRISAGRGFYPRIYVVGTKSAPSRLDPAGYDSVVTQAVTRHIVGLLFHPALVGGRPLSSTVLVACHRSPGA